ncbi:APC family permease [Brevibacillus fluminis]|uniref:APC family permease n=1 Tax=Brevibacillus fluminis TaxID=511487 RepID=A0A3M8DV35_9BACL|nr:APC family permease [Brevibacillus fluminis]RNB91956.1 APC family permease [Brevibacillus fluminis]
MKEKETTSLKRSLKLSHVVILGLGYMTPMTVFDTFGIVSTETGGHVPTAYLLALVAMLFTASSYGKMVKEFPVAGSAYTYTRKTINPHVGFLVGWLAMLDYLFLPMINVLLTKIYGSAAFPDVPGWMWIVGATLILTIINILGANTTANFNSLLVLFQVCVTGIFVILAYRAISGGLGTGQIVSAAPFVSPTMSFATLMTGASILCFSFLGFDAVSTYTEEAIEPKKTIPRGIFLTALIGGLIFITASYFGTAAFPDVSIFNDPEAPSPEIAAALGGAFFKALFLAGALVGTVASGLASHTSASRLLYAMGREHVLPNKLFGYVSPRFRTPVINIIVIGIFCLSALVLELEQAISFINFGALTAFTFVNLSVIAHFIIRKKMRGAKAMFRYLISPLIGASFVGYLWYNLDLHSITLGLVWAAIGILYLVITTKGFKAKPPTIDFEEAV